MRLPEVWRNITTNTRISYDCTNLSQGAEAQHMKQTNSIGGLKIAATFIGTVVGAGFASGQEILQFFNIFRQQGLFAILVVSLLFIVFGYIIMSIGRKIGSDSHNHIINQVSGPFLGRIFDFIITFFLFGAFTAMAAGTGAMLQQQFRIPFLIGSALLTALTALTVLFGVKGVVNAISMVVPFLLGSLILICILVVFSTPFSELFTNLSAPFPGTSSHNPAAIGGDDVIGDTVIDNAVIGDAIGHSHNNDISSNIVGNWFSSSILYVSYNTILSIAVLGMLGVNARNEKSVRRGAILGGLGLGVGILAIFLSIANYLPEVYAVEIPMLVVAGKVGLVAQLGFSIVLIAEMYTTAVGSLYSFMARMQVSSISLKNTQMILIASGAAFFASNLGFSNIVKYVYPVIGYSGILLLVLFLVRWRRVK